MVRPSSARSAQIVCFSHVTALEILLAMPSTQRQHPVRSRSYPAQAPSLSEVWAALPRPCFGMHPGALPVGALACDERLNVPQPPYRCCGLPSKRGLVCRHGAAFGGRGREDNHGCDPVWWSKMAFLVQRILVREGEGAKSGAKVRFWCKFGRGRGAGMLSRWSVCTRNAIMRH